MRIAEIYANFGGGQRVWYHHPPRSKSIKNSLNLPFKKRIPIQLVPFSGNSSLFLKRKLWDFLSKKKNSQLCHKSSFWIPFFPQCGFCHPLKMPPKNPGFTTPCIRHEDQGPTRIRQQTRQHHCQHANPSTFVWWYPRVSCSPFLLKDLSKWMYRIHVLCACIYIYVSKKIGCAMSLYIHTYLGYMYIHVYVISVAENKKTTGGTTSLTSMIHLKYGVLGNPGFRQDPFVGLNQYKSIICSVHTASKQ